ncbi:MAG: translocation/assembly module TamB domain-containing protein, partial [Deferrisomatales bacterium]
VRLYVPRDLDARGRAVGRFGGPYRDLVFEYDVDLASVLAHGEDLGRLTGRTRYDLHDLTLQGAALTGGWGEVRATGTAGLHAGGEYRLDVEAEVADFAALVALAPAELSLNPAGLGGAGWARGRLVGPLEEPEFAGEAGVEGLTAFGYAVSRAAARGRASAVAWTLEDAEVNAYGGVATARGGGDLERFGIQGELAGLRLEEVAGAHGAELPIEGELTADFLARGPYGSPTAELSGSLGALRVLGRSQGDVAIRARYEGGRAEAEALAFEGGAVVRAGLDLSGELPLTVDARFLDLPWGALPLDVLPPSLHARSVTGRLRLDGLLGGEDRRLWVQGSGALEAVRWQGVDLGRVVLEGAAGAEGARASVRLWEGEAVVSAVLPPPPDGLLEVGAVLEGFALSRLRPLAPVPEGRVTARVRAGLSPAVLREAAGVPVLDALAFLEGTGSLTEVAFPDGSPGPEWRFRAETKEGKPELRLESDGVSLRAAAEGAPGGDWSLEALLEGFSPGRWVPPGHPLESLRGAVTARGSARGLGLELAEASATGSVEGLSWGPALPSTWEWTAAWRGGRGSLEAREARGTAVVAHRSPEGELTLRAELQGLSLEEWLDYPGLPEDFSGEVEGQGSLSWAPDAGVSGRLDLTRLRLEVPPAAVENVGPVRVSYEAGEARAESLRLEGSGLTLTAAGSLRPGEEWALDLEGSLDLGALRGWVPAVRRGSGTARAELELRGPWEAPRVMGPMVVEPGATLYLEPLGQPVEDLDASAFFDARQGLVVEWLDAQVGPGRVHLEGSVGLDGLRPGRLRLLAELRNIAQERPPRVTSLLDADLLFTGTAERPEIRGDIRLKEFLYEQRVNLKTLVFEAIQRRPREVRGLPEAGTVFVDLAVRGDDNLRVENNLADLSLAVDLRARGHLPRPALWGRVDVQEGIVRLRAVEYEVLRSSVEFLGETRPVPRLDLHARTSVRQYDVSVDIFGPLDDYQVTLASLPPLPHNDIVALLTVGTTAGEMQDAQALTAAEAASFLTGRLQDELESEVGEILGFDQFQIDPVYSPATQTTVPRVTVGKAISRSLFARYSAAFGGEAEQDFEVQYSLTRRLSLLGTWNDRGAEAQGSFGGELRVRFPFR